MQDINNVARVVSDESDPALANNTDADRITVRRRYAVGGGLLAPLSLLEPLAQSPVGLAIFMGSLAGSVILAVLRKRRSA